jgi:hypothetical protein
MTVAARHRMVALIVTLAVVAFLAALYLTANHTTVAGTNWDNIFAGTAWDNLLPH